VECQERLRDAKVAVLGVGGLGCWSALALACTGIGEMRLIDSDEVEVSNLNRQIIYMEADLGFPKAERAADRLRAFNSQMRVISEHRRLESQADISEFIAGSDVVIDAADWPAHEIELWCNAACFDAGIPYITMSHFPPIARVGPLYVPGETGCYLCQLAEYRREYPFFDLVQEQRRAKPSPAATLGPVCGLIGSHVALDVLHLLTGLSKPSTHGVAHIYDLRTMEVKRESVTAESGCLVCGNEKSQA
jgi:molybdopterin-synthase adenylyltransferase